LAEFLHQESPAQKFPDESGLVDQRRFRCRDKLARPLGGWDALMVKIIKYPVSDTNSYVNSVGRYLDALAYQSDHVTVVTRGKALETGREVFSQPPCQFRGTVVTFKVPEFLGDLPRDLPGLVAGQSSVGFFDVPSPRLPLTRSFPRRLGPRATFVMLPSSQGLFKGVSHNLLPLNIRVYPAVSTSIN
jgi:hypothetical protein